MPKDATHAANIGAAGVPAADGRIPFNVPTLEGNELLYVYRAVDQGHSSASGPFSETVSETLRKELGAAGILLTTSCTSALEMSAMLLDIKPGDTVIVPSFTFVSTALAFVRQGARLLFADIEPATLGLDPAHVEALIDDSVRAVVPVHYAGIAGDLAALQRVVSSAERAEIVEDNAHGLFAQYRDRPLGTFGRFGALSFHETKNFVCGEGGALIVNDPNDLARAQVLYDKGTNREAFRRGIVDKYTWKDVGSSFGLSDILAAYLAAQLEMRESILAKRRRVFELYEELLSPSASEFGFQTPMVPEDRTQGFHMFYLLLPDGETRDRALKGLAEERIQATFHYVPLHSSEGARPHIARTTDCPVSDDVSRRILRLPFHNALTEDEVRRVTDALLRLLA